MITDEQRGARFTAWLTDYRGIILKIVHSYAAEAADQADLFQEVLLQIWRSLPGFRGQAKPSTWIYRVGLNTALTWRRQATRRERGREPGVELSQIKTEAF